MLIFFFLKKFWFIWSTNNTVRFFSEYFTCHFHFFWSKILLIIFAAKPIRCSRLFSNFYPFYLSLCVFHVLHYQFFIVIFLKLLVIWLAVKFFIFVFNSLFLSCISFISASFCFSIFLLFLLFQLLYLIEQCNHLFYQSQQKYHYFLHQD